MSRKNGISIGLIVIAIIYTLSPIDFFPGPIDDVAMDTILTVSSFLVRKLMTDQYGGEKK